MVTEGKQSLKRVKIKEFKPLPDEVEALKEEHEYLPLDEVEKLLSRPYPYGR